MKPRHGFAPQPGDPPVELVMDQYQMDADQYLRVTLRSKRAFKGFLLRAESEKSNQTGSWYIPYLEDNSYLSESRYLHCRGGQQNAVTHSGRTATMFVVSFQWKPPSNFQGRVVFRATVVVNYRLFWVDITAAPVVVGDPDKTPRKYFRSTDATSGTTRRGGGGASPTAFYDEWNSSAVSTERSEQTTIEGNLVIGNEAEVPRGVLGPNMDLEGQPSWLRPTAVLPARPSSSWRDQTVIFQEEAEKGLDNREVRPSGSDLSEKEKGESETGGSVAQFGPKKVSEEGGRTTSPYVDILLKGSSLRSTLSQSEEKDTRGSGILLTPSSRRQEGRFDLSTVTGWRGALESNLTEATDPTEILDTMSSTTTSAISTVQTTLSTETTSATARETVTTSVPIQLTYRQKGHKFIEPTFLFTTSSPRQTKQLTTTLVEENLEERDGHSVASHFFQLEDYPETEQNFSIGVESDNLGEFSEEADAAVRESWMYNVENNTSEEVTELVESDKELGTNTSIASNGTSNELERRPRDNTGGEHESLEGAYKRLEAQYGSWQNSAVELGRTHPVFVVIFFLLRQTSLL